MNRLLTFHVHETSGNEVRMAPSAYYMDAEYSKVAVRIYAEKAPVKDAKFDIFDDGVSIFKNATGFARQILTGQIVAAGTEITGADDTEQMLAEGQNGEEFAEDFNDTNIAEGSWVYCNLINGGGAKNITVQLELYPMSEGEPGDD